MEVEKVKTRSIADLKIYKRIGSIYPNFIKKKFAQELIYAGETTNVLSFLGSMTVLSLIISLGVLLFPLAFSNNITMLNAFLGILSFIAVIWLSFVLIYFKAEDRTQRVEEVLPDVLQLISSNIRAGMTPYQALRIAARKEFGPLYYEIKNVTSKSLGTKSFEVLLLDIGTRFKSEILERALSLFTTAMHSGGHLAILLNELAVDIEDSRSLKQDLVTATKTYSSFIMFSILISTPLLLAVSIQFLDFITGIHTQSSATAGASLGLFGEISITVGFLTILSIVLLIVTSLLASLLIGVIKEGKLAYGLRFFPIIATGSLIIFFVLRNLINTFFGGLV
jgi:Flp pilus assembly protein TadB